jgi:hypothetical protein
MYSPPTAPRSIGGIVDDAIRLYRASFTVWIFPSLLMAVVGFAVSLYMTSHVAGAAASPAVRAQIMAIMRSPSTWLGYVLIVLFHLWLYCVIVSNVLTVANGGQAKAFGDMPAALRMLPSAFAAGILFFIALVAGTILLIIPGIYVWGRLQYWIVALMADRSGPVDALGTSWRLVKGHWWRSSTIFTVLFVIMIALFMVVGFVGGLLAVFLRSDLAVMMLVNQSISGVINIFAVPIVPVALVAIYQDLKLRAGGADLQARISSLRAT